MKTIIAALLLIPTVALAWENPPKPAPHKPTTKVHVNTDVEQHQKQGQEQSQTNEGNTLTAVNNEARQAPSTAQGSFAIVGCGAAGNAGGSNTHGSAFLGFGFTPAECYKYMTAAGYQALGEYETACLILNTTRAAKRAEKMGVALPTCKRNEVAIVVTVPPADYVTREELIEREKRIVETLSTK